VDAYGREDYQWFSVHRGRRYLYPVMLAVFGIRMFLNNRYDLIELWGGQTWLLAVILRWVLRTDVPIIHRSNGIEQHRLQVVRESQGKSIQNTRWFQRDISHLYDWGLRSADAIITVSSFDLPFLRSRQYVPDERIHAIDNPLPSQFLDQEVAWERPNRVGFCGSWIPRKGLSVLRTDMAHFLQEHPDWTFSVVGSGDTDVKAEFPEGVREQIEVIPFLDRRDLIDWYRQLAVFTLPSIYESFGLVMAESMACGAALIATNVGFAHGLKHETEALILPKPQPPHLYDSLSTLAADESLRIQIAQGGYLQVQKLRWKVAVDSLDSFYKSVS
jgi:glycosyltransferase involved in cell wall biosynthesis